VVPAHVFCVPNVLCSCSQHGADLSASEDRGSVGGLPLMLPDRAPQPLVSHIGGSHWWSCMASAGTIFPHLHCRGNFYGSSCIHLGVFFSSLVMKDLISTALHQTTLPVPGFSLILKPMDHFKKHRQLLKLHYVGCMHGWEVWSSETRNSGKA
jgi:hypothetical protein